MITPDNTVRLSKRMAELGLCSRREADAYIERGWVSVNGEKAVLGQRWARATASSCTAPRTKNRPGG